MEPLIRKKESAEETQNLFTDEIKISSWENTLTLPEIDGRHPQQILQLENRLQFTYVRKGDRPAQVFVSEKTSLIPLCRYLPFLFSAYRLFRCPHRLIAERLEGLNREGVLLGSNLATKSLKFLLEKAVASNASDIHLESLSSKKRARIRINGELRTVSPSHRIEESLFSKVKLISGMDIAKKRSPQDGHFQYVTDRGKRYDLRTSTVPAVTGEKIVIRLLPATSVALSLSHLGMRQEQIRTIQSAIRKKSGMILFTGPTGSGKTTSLYGILTELLAETLNIVTIEDPVEYRLENITQVEVNEAAGLSFHSALRAFLRQDPDVILVGEIRDGETAQIAARAAQTGHLVLSTLHCNNVFEAIHRLKNLGVANDDLSSSLRLVISQRLMNRICTCRKRETACSVCGGSGIDGRVPLLEMLPIEGTVRRLLVDGAAASDLERAALAKGFVPLMRNGRRLVREGLISQSELDAVCL